MAKKRKKKSAVKRRITTKYWIGVLHSGSKSEGDHQRHYDQLTVALHKVYPRNLVDFDDDHYPKDDPAALGDEAKKLVTNKNAILIASGGSLALAALMQARSLYGNPKTPIVFTSVSDPPQPDQYLTGVNAQTSSLDPDRLELVFELIGRPQGTKIRAIKNPRRPNFKNEKVALMQRVTDLNTKGANIDFDIKELGYSSDIDDQIGMAFTDFQNSNVAAVVVTADPLYYNRRQPLLDAVKATKIPTIYQWRKFTEDGGLISYGSNLQKAYELAGTYVGTILKDMDAHGGDATQVQPVLSPLFELVINTTTAEDQNVNIPPLLAARAELIS